MVKDRSFTHLSRIHRAPVAPKKLLILWKQTSGSRESGFQEPGSGPVYPEKAIWKLWKMREGTMFHNNTQTYNQLKWREGVKGGTGKSVWGVWNIGCKGMNATSYTANEHLNHPKKQKAQPSFYRDWKLRCQPPEKCRPASGQRKMAL